MHPKLLESTIAQCRAYMDAGDCHGKAPPSERLIDAVVQLARDLAYYKPIAERYTDRLLHTAGAAGPIGDPECRAPDCDCARREDIPEGACAAEIVSQKQDAAFLATRLRRLFAHFNYPLPNFASDDARLIGIAGSAIGALLTRWETDTPQPVAWVNGDELRNKANATIACGHERRWVNGHEYDTPLYAAIDAAIPSQKKDESPEILQRLQGSQGGIDKGEV